MKKLNITQTRQISGGKNCTSCKDALAEEALHGSIEDITQFCTPTQYKSYASAYIDLMYKVGFWDITDQMEVEMIRGLDI